MDIHDRRETYDEYVYFPLAQDPVEQPLTRPACRRLTCQSDRELVDVVKVSAVLINVIPGLVDNHVPTGLTGATHSACKMPPLVRQTMSEEVLSADEKVVDDSECWNDVVGGPTSTPLGQPYTLLEMSPLVCRSRPTLLEMSPSVCHPRPTLLGTSPSV